MHGKKLINLELCMQSILMDFIKTNRLKERKNLLLLHGVCEIGYF